MRFMEFTAFLFPFLRSSCLEPNGNKGQQTLEGVWGCLKVPSGFSFRKDVMRTCEYPGCGGLGRNKGLYKGKTRFDRFCEKHHRTRSSPSFLIDRAAIDNSRCEKCGWNEGPCDRHRIDSKQGYKRDNVKVLCPNCHRLEHLRSGGRGNKARI